MTSDFGRWAIASLVKRNDCHSYSYNFYFYIKNAAGGQVEKPKLKQKTTIKSQTTMKMVSCRQFRQRSPLPKNWPYCCHWLLHLWLMVLLSSLHAWPISLYTHTHTHTHRCYHNNTKTKRKFQTLGGGDSDNFTSAKMFSRV